MSASVSNTRQRTARKSRDAETIATLESEGRAPALSPGTLIATPQGLRPVETLAPGDMVLTADSGPRRVRFVAARRRPAPGRGIGIHICLDPSPAQGGTGPASPSAPPDGAPSEAPALAALRALVPDLLREPAVADARPRFARRPFEAALTPRKPRSITWH